MEGVLNQVIGNHKITHQQLEKNNNLLSEILGVQKSSLALESEILKQDKRDAQTEKRKKADNKNPLAFLKKEEDKAKKKKGGILGGIFDTIKNLLMGLGGKGILGALGLAGLGAVIAGLFTSKEFRDGISNALFGDTGLFGKKNRDAFGKGIVDFFVKDAPWKESFRKGIIDFFVKDAPWKESFRKGFADFFMKDAPWKKAIRKGFVDLVKSIKDGLIGFVTGLVSNTGNVIQNSGSNAIFGTETTPALIEAQEEQTEAVKRLNETLPGEDKSKEEENLNLASKIEDLTFAITQSEASIKRNQELAKEKDYDGRTSADIERLTGRDSATTMSIKLEKEKIKKLKEEIENLKKQKAGLGIAPNAYQSGGFVGTVPNQGGNGDRFRTMLSPGSVVLNQTASAFMQSGGMIPAMLEQGERVFSPRDPNAGAALMMNSMIPRFQEGGTVNNSLTGDTVNNSLTDAIKLFSGFASAISSILGPLFSSMFGSIGTMFSSLGKFSGSGSGGMGILGGFGGFGHSPSTVGESNITYPSVSGNSLLDFIGSGEGGYNSMNQGTIGNSIVGSTHNASGKIGKDLTSMKIGEIMQRQTYLMDSNNPQESDYGIYAAGKYQIIPGTMKEILPKSGLTKDDMFSKENQDKLGVTLVTKKRPRVASYINGTGSLEGAMDALSSEFASIPDPRTGRSKYGSGNSSSHSVEEVQRALIAAKKENLGMQTGGLSQVRGTGSMNTTTMITKSQENFAKMIAQNATPMVVPVPMGGGGASAPNNNSADTPFPSLPAEDNSVVSMEYKYRITMGASV